MAPCGLDIGKREVPALEQQGLTSSFRQRVGKAVAEVQSRRVVALAESPPGPARGLRMVGGDRRKLDWRPVQEEVKLTPGRSATTAFQNNGRLQKASDRHAAT